MKNGKKNDKSDFSSKKATLSNVPKSTSRWRDPAYKSASGKAMSGGRFKK